MRLITFISVLFPVFVCAQFLDSTLSYVPDGERLDTVRIYRSLMRMPIRNYERNFTKKNFKNVSYRFNYNRMSEQDITFYELNKKRKYLLYYDRKNRLRMEGRLESNLVQEVMYYSRKGDLKRKEYWNEIFYFEKDANGEKANDTFNWETPIQECGEWIYYKKGKPIKIRNYFAEVNDSSITWKIVDTNLLTFNSKTEMQTIQKDSNFVYLFR